ncbi:MAG: ABC transporter ATP-binding protein [Roseiflexaceae bacterium]|nr:ABC transporter ATP-binding protein [Roseiflexaceae bacterium]
MQADTIIEIQHLCVQYNNVQAVKQLDLTVRRGEVFGMLGPNGAGKSSTLSCIMGLRRPDGGTVRVDGHDVARDPLAVKRILGVQLQKSALFNELTAVELIELYAALYEVFPTRAQIMALLERFGLAQKAGARAPQLSGGQQQRLALAIALVNNPQVVLLDEPTTGLDPQARRGVWAMVRRMREEGRTVLLTTHYMDEAQELCDRIGIIDNGVLVALDTPLALIARHAPPLSPQDAARRQPNLEDVFLALTGRGLDGEQSLVQDDEARWLATTT